MNSIQNRPPNMISSLHSRRSLNELSMPRERRCLAAIEPPPPGPPAMLRKSSIPGQYKPDTTNNKWYKEPKIPVQLNSSTLIRRKTNTNSGLDNVVGKEPNNQLALNAATFLKRERRACDLVLKKYEIAPKGMLPFDKSSYIKDVLSKIVSSGDNGSLHGQKTGLRPSANPSGDGVDQSGTYHRVSALSINDLKSGCNLKYVEEVSFQAKTSSANKTNVDMTAAEVVTKLENVRVSSQSTREWNPTKSEIISKFTTPRQFINHGDSSDDNDDAAYNVIIKKKCKKNKKPVVVTCLKNSTVKYVKRKST